jgi:hypothetical protein
MGCRSYSARAAPEEEAASLMRVLLRRTDRRLHQLIWHLDIGPLVGPNVARTMAHQKDGDEF